MTTSTARVRGAMHFRYDKRIAVQEQVTGEAIECSKDEREMSDCIVHEVKRSVRYDSGWRGTRGNPGDNEIRHRNST